MDSGFIGILIIGAGFWFWYWTRRAHEHVNRVSRKICQDLDLQRLDESIVLRAIRPSFRKGRIVWYRRYRFEYSQSGVDRKFGELTLFGPIVEEVRLMESDGTTQIIKP